MVENKETEERERGTLSKTLPKRPDVIFGIANLVGTAASVYCCRSQLSSPDSWPSVVSGSALGSLATIAGIAYSDSSVHSLFLGVAIFATYLIDGIATGKDLVETFLLAFVLSRAMILVAVLSKIVPTLIAVFSSKIILNPIMIISCCCLPLISFVMGASILLAQQQQVVYVPVGVSITLAIATLTLCGLYYYNRSNTHGNLIIQPNEIGMMVMAALAFAFTAQSSQVSPQVASAFLPILIGSNLTTLLALTFASVADVWDAVGSGQFQMISVDTAALIGYVVAPVLVLAKIACNKYGDAVGQVVSAWLQSVLSDDFIARQERPPEQAMISGLYLLLSLSIMIGVPLVNTLCPMVAYLMSRAYTNGQPRTKRAAICILFKDILNESKEQMDETINRCTDEKFPVLNIFVTVDEIRLFSEMIRKLKAAGHSFGICSNNVEGIMECYEVYIEILDAEPLWYFVGSTSTGRGPDALKAADDLGLKVAFWSTHIAVTSREVLLGKDVPKLLDDVTKKGGGSFIYLTNDWDDLHEFTFAIEAIGRDLESDDGENKCSFCALSNVAKEDPAMIL